MRYLIAIILICSLPAYGAIATTMQWDVRSTGNDANGGGYDPAVGSPGTDESQGNTGTTMTVTIGGTTTQGTSSPAFSSTTHGPGNVMKITSGSGCTVGWYEEISQSGGTATFDRSLGTAASTCTATMGGSFATLCSSYSSGCQAGAYAPAVTAGPTSYNTIWIKGTFAACTILATSACYKNTNLSNADITYMAIVGYTTTHGDGGRASLSTTTNSTNIFGIMGTMVQLQNLNITMTAGTPFSIIGIGSSASYGNGELSLNNCVLDLSGSTGGNGIFNFNGSTYMAIWNSKFILNSTATGITDEGGNTGHLYVANSYFTGAGTGIYDGNTANGTTRWSVIGSTFSGNSRGIYCQNGSTCDVVQLISNNFYSATNEDVYITNTSSGVVLALNNVFWGGTYGMRVGAIGKLQMAQSNAYGNQGTAAKLNFGAGFASSDVTLTANPFTATGSDNFALNTTAGGGAALRAAGFPGVALYGTGYMTIGALQPNQAVTSNGGPRAFVQ